MSSSAGSRHCTRAPRRHGSTSRIVYARLIVVIVGQDALMQMVSIDWWPPSNDTFRGVVVSVLDNTRPLFCFTHVCLFSENKELGRESS